MYSEGASIILHRSFERRIRAQTAYGTKMYTGQLLGFARPIMDRSRHDGL